MKTVADMRRTLVEGVTVDLQNHRFPELSGHRTVVRAQANSWCLSLPPGHPRAGQTEGSWLNIPKAKDVRANEDDSITICANGVPFCTIRLIKEEL